MEKNIHFNHKKEILYGIAFNFHFDKKFSESIKICEKLINYKDFRYSIQDLLASNYKKKKIIFKVFKYL